MWLRMNEAKRKKNVISETQKFVNLHARQERKYNVACPLLFQWNWCSRQIRYFARLAIKKEKNPERDTRSWEDFQLEAGIVCTVYDGSVTWGSGGFQEYESDGKRHPYVPEVRLKQLINKIQPSAVYISSLGSFIFLPCSHCIVILQNNSRYCCSDPSSFVPLILHSLGKERIYSIHYQNRVSLHSGGNPSIKAQLQNAATFQNIQVWGGIGSVQAAIKLPAICNLTE